MSALLRSLPYVCGVFASLATAQQLPDATLARDLGALSPRDRGVADEVVAGLAEIDSELRLVAIVPRLDNRYGCFADLDADGDLDYVATERIHGREEVRLHENTDHGWRPADQVDRGFEQRHPFLPWVLADDGSGHAAVVLPVGWPPYLLLLPTNGKLRFVGRPIPLADHLPLRLSKPAGVDNCPYEIHACEAATGRAPARITGRMRDRDGADVRDVEFVITLGERGPTMQQTDWPAGPELGDVPTSFAKVASQAGCRHESIERGAILATELVDVTRDGTDDLVIVSGVLSAHVFPGRLVAGVLSFGSEVGGGRDVPIEDLRFWFPVAFAPDGPRDPFAGRARSRLDRIGLRIAHDPRFDAALSLWTERRKGWLVDYYRTDAGLVPVTDYRRYWPGMAGAPSLRERHRQSVILDADHDRSPDVLSVHVGQPYRWIKEPPPGGGVIDESYYRDIRPGRQRAGLVLGLGEHRDDAAANRVLTLLDEAVTMPDNPNAGMPISVYEVPVHSAAGGRRSRFCVFLRERRLGLFFEVAAIPVAEARSRARAAWTRRGERRLEMHEHYWACDRSQCTCTGRLHQEVFADAAALFARALEFASGDRERGLTWRRIARCEARAGRIAAARAAYEKFVNGCGCVESRSSCHPDLAPLFADAKFLLQHRAWSRDLPVVAATAIDTR